MVAWRHLRQVQSFNDQHAIASGGSSVGVRLIRIPINAEEFEINEESTAPNRFFHALNGFFAVVAAAAVIREEFRFDVQQSNERAHLFLGGV
jgi:hypothetical protein